MKESPDKFTMAMAHALRGPALLEPMRIDFTEAVDLAADTLALYRPRARKNSSPITRQFLRRNAVAVLRKCWRSQGTQGRSLIACAIHQALGTERHMDWYFAGQILIAAPR